MDCKEANGLLAPYILGALDSGEMARMDDHVATCPECLPKLRAEGDVAAEMAYAVPQRDVPPGVRRRLLSRIDSEASAEFPPGVSRQSARVFWAQGPRLAAYLGTVVASVLLVVVVLGGAWYNRRLNDVAEERVVLATQVASVAENVAENEAEIMDMIQAQRYLTYMAASPGMSVKRLSATDLSSKARGMIVISATGSQALLSAIDLPTLPAGKAYQVWLVRFGQVHDGGMLKVDSMGYGQTNIELSAPVREFDAIIITVERAEGSPGPTGESVLKGDL